jgi:hypothetical protein
VTSNLVRLPHAAQRYRGLVTARLYRRRCAHPGAPARRAPLSRVVDIERPFA